MLAKRTILAGLVAGVAMYVWSSVAHVVLPLGMVGFQEIPNEAAVVEPMRGALGQTSGMYIFPGMGQPPASMQQYEAKLAAGPHGLLIYHPPGGKPMSAGQLITEFVTELVEALLAVFLLAQTRLTTFGGRVAFVAGVGLVAAITTNIPYWNWYGFPSSYTAAYMTIEIVAYIIAGLVAAGVMRSPAAGGAVAQG